MSDTYVDQVGGDHYQAEIQHWDWVPAIHLGYLEGTATKYVDRYKKKHKPIEDLEKALSYVKKTIAVHEKEGYSNSSYLIMKLPSVVEKAIKDTQKFSKSSGHDPMQTAFMMTMAAWQNLGDLKLAQGFVERMLRDAKEAAEGKAGAVATIGGQATTKATTPQKTGGCGAASGQGQGAVASSRSTDVVNRVEQAHPFGYEEEN